MGLFDFLKKKTPKGIDNPYEYYSVNIVQSSEESVVTEDGRYDLTRFSVAEDRTIREAINAANTKYTQKYRAIGLANESYPIVYKPRYVLFDVIVIAYGQSDLPLDQLAVSFAYIQKGARYRQDAIRYFENAIDKVSWSDLNRFSSVSALTVFTKIAETYEREHDYKSAIKWYNVLVKKHIGNTAYFRSRIVELEEKDKNWKPLRKRNPSSRDLEFDDLVYKAALSYAQYLNK